MQIQPYIEKNFGNKPILRLVGGKQKVISDLMRKTPPVLQGRRYIEPFLGGGSLFLALKPAVARLNDLNPLLIQMYRCLRDDPGLVHQHLVRLAEKHEETFYYGVRMSFNGTGRSHLKAAQFIYLNRACYNGVFRVNQRSEFNVPWGRKERVLIPTLDNLTRLAGLLADVELLQGHFAKALGDVGNGDFVYLDPPYPPVSRTSFFRHYTARRFSSADHTNVATWANLIADRGAHVMVSNADTLHVRAMYSGWHITAIRSPRYVTSKKSNVRRAVDLIITNYSVNSGDSRRT